MKENDKCMKKTSELDNRVKWVLLIGVLSSVILMIFGLALFASQPGIQDEAVSLKDMPLKLTSLNPVAVISLGIIVLIATPVFRVITVILTMAKVRDTTFMLVGLLVLAVLLLSFLLAPFK